MWALAEFVAVILGNMLVATGILWCRTWDGDIGTLVLAIGGIGVGLFTIILAFCTTTWYD